MGILDVIFKDTMPWSVSKIKENKGQTFSRLVGLVPSELKEITLQSPELCETTRYSEVVLQPQEVPQEM
jgi:hypothetical protein